MSKTKKQTTRSPKGKTRQTKAARTARRSRTRRTAGWRTAVPERLTTIESVEKALNIMEQRPEVKALEKAAADLGVRMDDLRDRLGRAGMEAALEHAMQQQLTPRLDEILHRVGLMRVAEHEQALKSLKKRQAAGRKAAQTRKRNATHKTS